MSKRKVRFRSVENVVSEIQSLIDTYNKKDIYFVDDMILANRKYFLTLAQELEKLDIRYYVQARTEYVDEEILSSLTRSGCKIICFGIESGNTEILHRIEKKLDLEKAILTINKIKEARIKVFCSYILGFPFETEAQIFETIRIALQIDANSSAFFFYTPFPHSKMWDYCVSEKLLDIENISWSMYNQYHPIGVCKNVLPDRLQQLYYLAVAKTMGKRMIKEVFSSNMLKFLNFLLNGAWKERTWVEFFYLNFIRAGFDATASFWLFFWSIRKKEDLTYFQFLKYLFLRLDHFHKKGTELR